MLAGPKGVCGIAMAGFWLGARAILGGLLRPMARRSWRSATNDSCRIRADNFDGIGDPLGLPQFKRQKGLEVANLPHAVVDYREPV
jgi:hypothetical protein